MYYYSILYLPLLLPGPWNLRPGHTVRRHKKETVSSANGDSSSKLQHEWDGRLVQVNRWWMLEYDRTASVVNGSCQCSCTPSQLGHCTLWHKGEAYDLSEFWLKLLTNAFRLKFCSYGLSSSLRMCLIYALVYSQVTFCWRAAGGVSTDLL